MSFDCTHFVLYILSRDYPMACVRRAGEEFGEGCSVVVWRGSEEKGCCETFQDGWARLSGVNRCSCFAQLGISLYPRVRSVGAEVSVSTHALLPSLPTSWSVFSNCFLLILVPESENSPNYLLQSVKNHLQKLSPLLCELNLLINQFPNSTVK